MKKNWFISIAGKKEGPFSIYDLKRDQRITPDTLVWKEGFLKWKKIREVKELKEIFFDNEPKNNEIEIKSRNLTITPQDEIILDLQKEPPYLFLVLIFLILLFYIAYQAFWVR